MIITDVNDCGIYILYEQHTCWKETCNWLQVPDVEVHDGVSGLFLIHFLSFMNKIEWLRKAETKEKANESDKTTQKHDLLAAVIFKFSMVKVDMCESINIHAICAINSCWQWMNFL